SGEEEGGSSVFGRPAQCVAGAWRPAEGANTGGAGLTKEAAGRSRGSSNSTPSVTREGRPDRLRGRPLPRPMRRNDRGNDMSTPSDGRRSRYSGRGGLVARSGEGLTVCAKSSETAWEQAKSTLLAQTPRQAVVSVKGEDARPDQSTPGRSTFAISQHT